MRYFLSLLLIFGYCFSQAQVKDYASYPVYSGKDLGLTYSPTHSFFRIWSPPASKAQIVLYKSSIGGEPLSVIDMQSSVSGTWTADLKGDHAGQYYAFKVLIDGTWSNEVPDPYAKLIGVNSKRAMIADLRSTNPAGWESDKSPAFRQQTDAVVYELHIRDASIHSSSGIRHKGKYIGLTEKGTRNKAGLSTGIDHIREMGVTHVHLLPFYDFFTVDETRLDKPQYNWGYDPMNYNAPEGSYSTNPYDGRVRVRELKKLVQSFHQNGLRLVMDVVYNHTMFSDQSFMNQLVPGYYYRQKPDGSFSDATACGNETASDRAMMRKFMLESVLYWVKEYHIDGFRFDLMGVHDIETMNLISRELHKIKPEIILYGEGWTAGNCPLPDSVRALKKNAHLLDRIAVFSDDLRDGIKGSVFEHGDRGFASGKEGMEQSIRFGLTAACPHPQVNYNQVNYSKAPYAAEPINTVSYCECHDNHVLWDKLALSATTATESERRQMHKLALSIVLTAQGMSFLHAGTEFLRSKQGVENSFNAGDSINAIDWNLKTRNKDVVDYVRELIAMRKAHPAFRMTRAEDIAHNISFLENTPPGLVVYQLKGSAVGDSWKSITVVFNGSGNDQELTLDGHWQVFSSNNKIQKPGTLLTNGKIRMQPYSCTIVYRK